MVIDKAIDSARLDADLAAVANAIRNKGGTSAPLAFPGGFVDAVGAIQTGSGGGAVSVQEKDVNFYDYEGTLLHSYTFAEAQALTNLPNGAEHESLTFQGWNMSLEEVKASTYKTDVAAHYITNDGKTHVHISLDEGLTSPYLGVAINGSVEVDWGDGSSHDVISGTNLTTIRFAPQHFYAQPGDYTIRLTVNGSMRILGSTGSYADSALLRCSNASSKSNAAYQMAVKKVHIGAGVESVGLAGLKSCMFLEEISIPKDVPVSGSRAFQGCPNLKFASLSNVMTSIPDYCFNGNAKMHVVSIPRGIVTINNEAFSSSGITRLVLLAQGKSVTIGAKIINGICNYLSDFVVVGDEITVNGEMPRIRNIVLIGRTINVGNNAFRYSSMVYTVTIAGDNVTIGSGAFYTNVGTKYYDFTGCTSVATLNDVNAFNSVDSSNVVEIRVPAAIYDEWISATNWVTYADHIVPR